MKIYFFKKSIKYKNVYRFYINFYKKSLYYI
nr:MAG TPA: hypothetical protein [Caudoviricetes sp.]